MRHEANRADRFGRIFPRLRPFAEPSPRLIAALLDIGKPGGVLDARDRLEAGPVALFEDAALSANNPNNPNHTAGTTFMGQFMDHDMTFDVRSRLGVPTDPERSENARTPAFDLDPVYGGGPFRSPHLYEHRDRAKFRVEFGGEFEDLPRDARMRAIIGDPRNDENVMISGLHAAVLLFHNNAAEHVRLLGRGRRSERGSDEIRRTFDEARRLTRWHYQRMILHEFLPLFVGQELVRSTARSPLRCSGCLWPPSLQATHRRRFHSGTYSARSPGCSPPGNRSPGRWGWTRLPRGIWKS